MPTTDRLPTKPMNEQLKQEYHCEACKSWHLEPCAFGIPNNATWRDKPMQDEQIESIIIDYFTRVGGQEINLQSTAVGFLNKNEEVPHLRMFVKMPSKDTKEFREALAQARHNERKAVIDEVLGTIQESLPLIKKELLAKLKKAV